FSGSAFNHRVDHVGLPSRLDLLARKVPDLRGTLVGDFAGGDGSSARRKLVEHAGIEIAIKRERQGAGDRSGGHDQRVRLGLTFFHEPEALHHAETVLLVHDDQAKVVELNLFLDQRVRADHQIYIALGDMSAGAAFAFVVERAGQQQYT